MHSCKTLGHLLLIFMLLLVRYISSQLCGVTVWKRIFLKDILVEDFTNSVNVSSGTACAEACASTAECKSFALSSVYTDQMTCYLYKYRVLNTGPSSDYTGLVYYWYIEEHCPVERGFSYNATLNACARLLEIPEQNWTACAHFCETEGGHLGIVNSRNKLEMFFDINEHYSSPFLGARIWNGSFYWLDGSPVGDYWYAGEPNNHLGLEEVVQIHSKIFYGIFDTRPNTSRSCICEIPLVDVSPQ